MKSFEELDAQKIPYSVIRLSEVPKSAQDVERLFGCPLHQVLKTVLFIGDKSPVLAVVPGDCRVDIEKLKKVSNQTQLRMASAQEVLNHTGYSIGGVTPFGVATNLLKVMDSSVFELEKVNIGSGEPITGIELLTSDLQNAWSGLVADIV